MRKIGTSMRFTLEARDILLKLAWRLGVNQSAVMEIALRHIAKLHDVEFTDPPAKASKLKRGKR